MTSDQLKQLLEQSLKAIPGIRGHVVADGRGSWDGTTYVACNRLGKGQHPKFVYRLENLGDGMLQVSLVISDSRIRVFEDLYAKKKVGKKPSIEGKDACISSGTISAKDVETVVREFYGAYDAEMLR